MKNLGSMSGKDALRLAKEESGLTEREIAVRVGVSLSIIKRYLHREDAYLPSLEMIPRLCTALGNDILLDWQKARRKKAENYCREQMLAGLLRAATSLERACSLLMGEESVTASVPQIEDELDTLIHECNRIRQSLPQKPTRCGKGKMVSLL